jgi:hypothetical protein
MSDEDYRVRGTLRASGFIRRRDKGERSVWAYPYGTLKAARQYFDQMPINVNEKEKIAHLNAERLLGLGQNERRQGRRTPA